MSANPISAQVSVPQEIPTEPSDPDLLLLESAFESSLGVLMMGPVMDTFWDAKEDLY